MAGAEIPFEGEILQIIWDAHRPRVPVHDAPGGRLIVGGPAEGLHGRVERWLRRGALAVLSEEGRAYAAEAGKPEIGGASCRERVGQSVSITVAAVAWNKK